MALILHPTAASKRQEEACRRELPYGKALFGTAKAGSPLFEFLISIRARPGEVAEEVRDKSGRSRSAGRKNGIQSFKRVARP
ncbi:hypothetical protein Ddc_04021 [Ditylenchus destructor]|nr:hypothetical protein Ddc_04021 [Ditylenchus destructor]